jgi:ribonuclease Z
MSNAVYKIWEDHLPLIIPDTQYTLTGFSICAFRSCFYIKELAMMFDCAIPFEFAVNYIMISHVHADHIANLMCALYRNDSAQKLQIYAPKKSADKLLTFLEASYDLAQDDDAVYDYKTMDKSFNLIGVDPSIIPQEIKGKKIDIEIIQCYHSVASIGFGLIEKKYKLSDEFKGLDGKKLGELRKQGININKEITVPIFCYLGDTGKEILEKGEFDKIEKYKNIMIECTFLKDDDLDQSIKTAHIHWQHLEPYIKSHPDNNFILYHFSSRYKRSEVLAFFANVNLKNIIPWVNYMGD